MKRSNMLVLMAGAALLAANSGCIVIGVGGWHGPAIWTETVTERMPIETAGLTAIEAKTHNGSITFEAQPVGAGEAFVTITKKTGGTCAADAEAAMAALDVSVEPVDNGTVRLGWKWAGVKHPSWSARVEFDIHAPGNLRFEAESHNGPLEVSGIEGDVRLETHNGSINTASGNGTLYARTHNGPVTAAYAGGDVTLLTHNGRIVADLSDCLAVQGRLTSHNGGIEVIVGGGTSAKVDCQTHNGGISCDAPVTTVRTTKHRLTATVGDGAGNLDVSTHNGGVRIKQAG